MNEKTLKFVTRLGGVAGISMGVMCPFVTEPSQIFPALCMVCGGILILITA